MNIVQVRHNFNCNDYLMLLKRSKKVSIESTRSIRALEERCRQFADNQAILQVRLLEKDSEIELLKVQLNTSIAVDEQLRLTKTKLDTEVIHFPFN
ncbi:unnamed protein product [Onchocerca flexuosa]|uniref:Tektin n=1 Tax=Onchocerca flexuosa TaxID=387005 RepID=A0A183HMU7_9BILA|nr:unnamed protein product [Onchocerca flexuosa]